MPLRGAIRAAQRTGWNGGTPSLPSVAQVQAWLRRRDAVATTAWRNISLASYRFSSNVLTAACVSFFDNAS